MKILLDECLPLDFRRSFAGHDAHTAQWAGFKSKKNGELLRAAESAGYDVFLKVDLHSRTNQIEDLVPFVDAILQALEIIAPGQIVAIP